MAFEGTLETAYRACLWSRVASRVLLPVASFPAGTPDALYAGVQGVDWSEHLGPRQTLAVDFASTASALTHTSFGAQKVKDAIVDQIRDAHGARPSVDRESPDVRVNVHVQEDVATVSIDLSGESLHRRGYRTHAGEAPLKENLAAGILLLAGWPALARERAPLVDPVCGSGTLLVEAAGIATVTAPGLSRPRFGFSGWRGHDAPLLARLRDEARDRAVRDPAKLPELVGFDADDRAVRRAQATVAAAGLGGLVRIARGALADATPPESPRTATPRGLVVANPPYGERLGQPDALAPLYAALGDVLRRRFLGWTAFVLTTPDLARHVGLRPARRHVVYNGAIECRLLELPVSEAPTRGTAAPGWRRAAVGPGGEALVNRIAKNLRRLRGWAKREGVTCYRVYDADLPEYAVAIDLYEDAAHVQEYAPPKTIDPAKAAARLKEMMAVVPGALGVAEQAVFLKVRQRQRGGTQYEKLATRGAVREVREGGLIFRVNLTDYVDTGLFLDHRALRAMIRDLAPGRRFLNLFAYTGTATVYAAAGGAEATTSVDLSNTYLDWAADNLRQNGFGGARHALVRADCREWLARERARYDLVLLAPPTFSSSKKMTGTFDVQRDHVALVADAARLLSQEGVLLFSTHARRFRMDEEHLTGLVVEDVTQKTLPTDFAHDPRFHRTWRITRAGGAVRGHPVAPAARRRAPAA